jgi:hypothetical protein
MRITGPVSRWLLASSVAIGCPGGIAACSIYDDELLQTPRDASPEDTNTLGHEDGGESARGSDASEKDARPSIDDVAVDAAAVEDIKASGEDVDGPPGDEIREAEASLPDVTADATRDGDGCAPLACELPSCTDTVRNAGESDIDCGGPTTCPRCATGKMCEAGTDCASGVCTGNLCRAATCTDTVRNGAETDVDCGGGTCPACATGRTCGVATDCQALVCSGSPLRCQAPTCTDGVRNQNETGVDCGGVCAPARTCPNGTGCTGPRDCQSVYCAAGGVCQTPVLKAQYYCLDRSAPNDGWLQPALNLVNAGSAAIPYSQLAIRYWYTNDGTSAAVFRCYSAVAIGGCAYMTGTLVTLSPARGGADRYLEIGFTSAGSLAAGASTGLLQPALEHGMLATGGIFTESNDYSYDGSMASFAEFTRVTVYRNGVLMWGIEP